MKQTTALFLALGFLFFFSGFAHSQDFIGRVAAVCKGEAPYAIAECACSVRNRLADGWTQERVLTAYHALPRPVTPQDMLSAQAGLDGAIACAGLYFMLSDADALYLGMDHLPATRVIQGAGERVLFYPKSAWTMRRKR